MGARAQLAPFVPAALQSDALWGGVGWGGRGNHHSSGINSKGGGRGYSVAHPVSTTVEKEAGRGGGGGAIKGGPGAGYRVLRLGFSGVGKGAGGAIRGGGGDTV